LNDNKDLRAIYRFTYDGMKLNTSGKYYCPQDVRMNALGLEYLYNHRSTFKMLLRYLPAYTMERDHLPMLNQAGEVTAEWNIGKQVNLISTGNYFASQDYHSTSFSLKCEVKF